MKIEIIENFINHCKKAIKLGLSYKQYEEEGYVYKNFFGNNIYKLKQENPDELIKEAISLYESNKRRNNRKESLDTNDKSEISYIRNEDGNIESYCFKIFIRDKQPLIGSLDRHEMNQIYRLYSYYGDALTQRIISRNFPELSLIDFKRILRAFNITKASAPFAPHMFEEHSEEELREIQLREKENSFLRKAEEDQIKNNEKLLRQYAQENIELKNKLEKQESVINSVKNYSVEIEKFSVPNSQEGLSDITVFISDLHVGAYNEKFGYIQLEDYNESEINRRLNKIVNYLKTQSFNSITVCNLGDSVDSYNKQTTRGGHELPTTMSNKEQAILYQRIMVNFFNKLCCLSKKVSYICVGESNHDGSWGWLNNMLLAERLKHTLNVKTYISNNPIDKFDINDTSILFMHGKDDHNQFKGFPLTLDAKTEAWFNNYFIGSSDSYKTRKIIVKGDLHQYAVSLGKHFDYISVPSVYGTSNWIAANFGKTPWGALVMEITPNNDIKNILIRD